MTRARTAAALLAAALCAGPAPQAHAAERANVAVAVATVWSSPSAPRALDRPALKAPVRLRRWLARLTTERRRELVGRIETQALYGAAVVVTDTAGRWSHVEVVRQRTPRSALGYPGWVPTRQLTYSHALAALVRRPRAVVTVPRAWLRGAGAAHRRLLRLSFGTDLRVLTAGRRWVVVAGVDGERRTIARSAVALTRRLADLPPPRRSALLARARRFLGLRYLWGGTSGWGFDCSGLTYAVYRSFGIGLPRDADRQALHGTPVGRSQLRRGDLVFFADPAGQVVHVAIYAGHGAILESPDSAGAVQIVPLSSRARYAGARRYLPG
jgi:gamma-D-glutamyl-L-lysine dipeptidyl-peptidase